MVHVFANVKQKAANDISETFGIPLTQNLGKYLGMPSIHGRVIANTFKYLLDKVHSRLAGWKTKFLSMASRINLIKSITSSIPIYAMQTIELPKSTCDAIDKCNKGFL